MMKKKKMTKKDFFLINQEESPPVKKTKKYRFLENSLLLKQTLISAWKSKLQLVILLLLTAFTTSLVTGSWISYQRIIEGQKTLQMEDANFDAVLPYTSSTYNNSITQIATQPFSLSLGRLYYQEDGSNQSVAVYFDNTIIGQEIKHLNATDLTVTYTREGNVINGISDFQWANPSHPLEFNLNNINVRASIYGQLMLKAEQTNNIILKNNYLKAASDLYNNLFINPTASQILESLKIYFTDWISVNSSDPYLNRSDEAFTQFLVDNKVNFRGEGDDRDLRIPNEVNVATDINNPTGVLATKLVKESDPNPRLTNSSSSDYGMNGQWMRIYRNFDANPSTPKEIISNFNQQYRSPNNYNMVTDFDEPNIFSYFFAQAVAALQNRRINVVNQFVTTAGIDRTGNSISVKVIDLGLERLYNKVNLKIFEGIYPTSRNEVAITSQYARTYGIRPGSTITISNKPFIVSGIGGDAFNIYPTINPLDPIPNTRNEFIVYAFPDAFNDGDWVASKDKTDTSLMYFMPWKNVPITPFDTDYFSDYFQKRIFSDNKLSDRFQIDYSKYLIEKYINNNPDFPTRYLIEKSLVAVDGDGQFDIYARGRKTLNSTILGFKYISYVGVIFLIIIVIFITYLIIKKAIQKGQVSMGILKSSGYSTWSIIVSYLAYPLIVLCVAIPIGWFVGLAIQVYFTEIFNTLFVLPYNVLDFKFIPLLISIVLICGFVLITTLLTGYHMLQKKPLALIHQTNDIASVGKSNKVGWLQDKLKDRFKSRFILSLSKTSWKKITITAVVIAVATLAITSTVSVPATITNMKENYFKTQKYKNNYHYQTPIPNMPLSKYGLYSWTNFNNVNKEEYYPVSASMPWPENVIINSSSTNEKLAWFDPMKYQKLDSNNSNLNDILNFYDGVDQATKDDILQKFNQHYLSIDNGPLDMNFLAWSYSWLGGRAFSNTLLKDLAARDLSQDKNFSNSLITFAVTLLPGILGVTNPGIPPGPEAITEILKQVLPGFIRQVLDSKGPNAYDYFAIGHNSVAYNPNYNNEVGGSEEELITQFKLGSTDSNLINKGLLDVEGINPNTKMLVMKSGLSERLKYNPSSNVIPMVINRSFAARYNLSVGDHLNGAPQVKTLYYKNTEGKYVPLPKDSWYYGADPTSGGDGSKSIWNKSANKWNYRGERSIEGVNNYNDSLGYQYDGIYDQNGKRILSDQAESQNDVNKVWLKLPSDITEEAKKGTLRSANGAESLDFDVQNVANTNDKNWIKPFSFDIANDYNGQDISPVNLLLNRIPEWYGAMLDKQFLLVDNNIHNETIKSDIEKMSDWWTNIVGSTPMTKYQIIGVQDSYDTAKAYIDQRWANSIAGYSYYNDRSDTKDPTYSPGIYQWFSGKLSASDDIYDIVGRMAFKRSADDYTMYSMTGLSGNFEEPIVANSDLLLRKKEMLNKMAEIALSASLLFIITTIICSILIVIMITDSFTDQFRRFMSHMKAEGYTNREINSFTLGIFTPWVFVGYAVGYILGFLTIFGFIQVITRFLGYAFPFAFIWWIIPLSLGIIALIYFSTFIINNYQLNKMDLIELLKTDE